MIEQLFFSGNGSHPFRHTDAEVNDTVDRQFESGAARDDLARRHFTARHAVCIDTEHSGKRMGERRGKGLLVIAGIGNDNGVHHDPWNLDVARVQRATCHCAFDLDDDRAT